MIGDQLMRKAFLLLLCFPASLCFGADAYPGKPVRIVLPFAAGGSADSIIRTVAQQLSQQMGQSFVVENRAGAGGTIGTALVAKAPPDGYTLVLMDTSTTMAPATYKSLPYDVVRDFTPVTQILGAPMVLVVGPKLNVNTLGEFIALAKANPGKLNFGSGGVGGVIHVPSELFIRAADVNIAHVPYKGGGEALPALMSGQIHMLIAGIPTVLPFVNSGRVKALAITTDGKRAPLMPNVPSMKESGVAGMEVYSWYGLAGPAGMAKDIADKIREGVVQALAVPSVRDRFIAQSSELVGSTPEEFSRHVQAELRRWGDVIRAAGIPPQ